MTTQAGTKPLPTCDSTWRIGFYLLTIGIIGLYSVSIMLLVLAWYSGINWNFNLMLMNVSNSSQISYLAIILLGLWMGMILVFQAASEGQRPQWGNYLISAFGMCIAISSLVELQHAQNIFIDSIHDYNVGVIPLLRLYGVIVHSFPIYIIVYAIIAVALGLIASVIWYRLLRNPQIESSFVTIQDAKMETSPSRVDQG